MNKSLLLVKITYILASISHAECWPFKYWWSALSSKVCKKIWVYGEVTSVCVCVCVCVCIHADGLVEPSFFDGTIMGQSYPEQVVKLYGLMQVDPTLARIQHFMQDSALLPYTLIVCGYLGRHFINWICRHGVVEWPARSCDLTLSDFFLWGALKDRDFDKKKHELSHS